LSARDGKRSDARSQEICSVNAAKEASFGSISTAIAAGWTDRRCEVFEIVTWFDPFDN
jgi:hypothetical protein